MKRRRRAVEAVPEAVAITAFTELAREWQLELTEEEIKRYEHFDRKITKALSNSTLNRVFGALQVTHHLGYTKDRRVDAVLLCWCHACKSYTREKKAKLLSGAITHCGCIDGKPRQHAKMAFDKVGRPSHVLSEDARRLGSIWAAGWVWGSYQRSTQTKKKKV